jgi:gas vesicle protein
MIADHTGASAMSTETQAQRDFRFVAGLLAGTAIGAGLVMLFAPKAANEVRERVRETARTMTDRASATYQDVSEHVGDTISDIRRKGLNVRDDVADSVAHGAHEVERIAVAVKARPTQM